MCLLCGLLRFCLFNGIQRKVEDSPGATQEAKKAKAQDSSSEDEDEDSTKKSDVSFAVFYLVSFFLCFIQADKKEKKKSKKEKKDKKKSSKKKKKSD